MKKPNQATPEKLEHAFSPMKHEDDGNASFSDPREAPGEQVVEELLNKDMPEDDDK